MRMKTYAGRSLAEIVPQIRDELGSGAVILKQRPIRTGGVGGFFAKTGIEVLAAEGDPGAAVAPAPALAAPAAAPSAGGTATAVATRPQLDVQDGESREALLRETFAEALKAHASRSRSQRSSRRSGGCGRWRRHRPRRCRCRLRWPHPPDGAGPDRCHAAPAAAGCGSRRSRSTDAAARRRGGRPGPRARARRARRWTPPTHWCARCGCHVEPFAAGRLRDLVRRRIASRFRIEQGWEPDGAARRIAVVGASGVGKTTAIANIAAGYTAAGLMVGIVVVDRPDRRRPSDAAAPRCHAPARRPIARSRTWPAPTCSASARRRRCAAACSASPCATWS